MGGGILGASITSITKPSVSNAQVIDNISGDISQNTISESLEPRIQTIEKEIGVSDGNAEESLKTRVSSLENNLNGFKSSTTNNINNINTNISKLSEQIKTSTSSSPASIPRAQFKDMSWSNIKLVIDHNAVNLEPWAVGDTKDDYRILTITKNSVGMDRIQLAKTSLIATDQNWETANDTALNYYKTFNSSMSLSGLAVSSELLSREDLGNPGAGSKAPSWASFGTSYWLLEAYSYGGHWAVYTSGEVQCMSGDHHKYAVFASIWLEPTVAMFL